jgi:hypothetical protein
MASLAFVLLRTLFYPDVNKISIELLKALETLTVTTLPRGIALLKATLFTDVTTILLECLRAAILAARSIRANNSPPKKIIQRICFC